MNMSELLVIGIVALIVCNPSKMPMLARHLGLLSGKINRLKNKASIFWQDQINQQQLLENIRKAREIEKSQ